MAKKKMAKFALLGDYVTYGMKQLACKNVTEFVRKLKDRGYMQGYEESTIKTMIYHHRDDHMANMEIKHELLTCIRYEIPELKKDK